MSSTRSKLIALILLLPFFEVANAGSSPLSSQNQFSAFITGRVLDRTGKPIARADVCADVLQLARTGELPCAISSRNGWFKIHVWHPAKYTVFAKKEADGYPDPTNMFYGKAFGDLPSTDVVLPGKAYEVIVRLGPKAGRIVGRFIDATSGKPIEALMAKFCRVDIPNFCWGTSTGFPGGKFRFLTPEVPFTFQVAVWAENDWQPCEITGEIVKTIEVELNRTMILTAKVQPVGKAKPK